MNGQILHLFNMIQDLKKEINRLPVTIPPSGGGGGGGTNVFFCLIREADPLLPYTLEIQQVKAVDADTGDYDTVGEVFTAYTWPGVLSDDYRSFIWNGDHETAATVMPYMKIGGRGLVVPVPDE